MKVVIGCPVANRAWVLERWFSAAKRACQGFDGDVEFVCVTTPSVDHTDTMLKNLGVTTYQLDYESRPLEEQRSHMWDETKFEMMAALRNELQQRVWAEHKADWFFSLDSDILARKGSLVYLLTMAEAIGTPAIAPLVDLSKKTTVAWNFMDLVPSYVNGRGGWAARRMNTGLAVGFMKVDMIAAAMFIHRGARDVEWASHPAGEDVGWAINFHKTRLNGPYIATNLVFPHLMQED